MLKIRCHCYHAVWIIFVMKGAAGQCSSNQFPCADGVQCIDADYFCDEENDCNDASDEILRNSSIEYPANTTFCRGLRKFWSESICVLPDELVSRNKTFCDDNGWQCRGNEFPCADGSKCIKGYHFCNEERQCSDGSDEIVRNINIEYDASINFCRNENLFPRTGLICVLPSGVSPQGKTYCNDWWECTSDEFACADGSKCLKSNQFCDKYRDCRDGSDEPFRNISTDYHDNASFCRGKGSKDEDICVLPAELMPYKKQFCRDDWQCKSNEFACADGSRCIDAGRFCDGIPRCRDGSDEPPYMSRGVNYDANVTFCRGKLNSYICVLPEELQSKKNDLCEDNWQCRDDEFLCADGSRCVKKEFFCDGSSLCRDGSDEHHAWNNSDTSVTYCLSKLNLICALPTEILPKKNIVCVNDWQCTRNDFLCTDGLLCIKARYFCDGIKHCRDGSDEPWMHSDIEYDANVTVCHGIESSHVCILTEELVPKKRDLCREHIIGKYRFQCLSNPSQTIWSSNLCNGAVDCPDLTDECLCPAISRPEICQQLIWEEDRPPYLECVSTENQTQVTNLTMICDKRKDCLNSEDEKGCSRTDLMTSPSRPEEKDYECSREKLYATRCDGIPECKRFRKEECECDSPPEFCQDIRFIGPFARCGSTQVFKTSICNGIADCTNATDERGCGASRFYCTNDPIPNIPHERICDGIKDCPNGADENSPSYFCCYDNDMKRLPLSMICDGIQDCQSGSDECQTGCIDSAFSDEDSMIANKALFAFVWIISTIALIGGLAVIVSTVHDLFWQKKSISAIKTTRHTKLIKILILSLAMSDILVAVYTLAICIKAAEFDKEYCLVDRAWRSSSVCSGLGAIMVIGSEQTVFNMVLIAVQRLNAVLRPFSQPNIRNATIAVVVSWLVAIFLGIAPVVRLFEDYFVSSIMFSSNQIFRVIYHNETQYTINWLNAMQQSSSSGDIVGATDWSKVRNLAGKLNPNVTVNYEFGYYSSHTVCLPTFFPDRSKDKAWAYTLLLLLLNFIAFLFMLISYTVLYRHATKRKALIKDSAVSEKREKQNMKMQRKLTRILFTDFLCWMPICIMGFLQIAGVHIPKDAYLPAGLIIIPINSALNPLLYSDLPEILINKLKIARKWFTQQTQASPNSTKMEVLSHSPVRVNAGSKNVVEE